MKSISKISLLVVAVLLAVVACVVAPSLVSVPLGACAVAVSVVALCPSLNTAVLISACNIGEGSWTGSFSKYSDAAIAQRFLLVKFGSDVEHVAINGVNDRPLGICSDEAAAGGELVAVQFLSATNTTRKAVASEAIALTDELYTAAGGKVQNLPAGAGTYYKIGRPLQTAAADGDVIAFEPCYPVAVIVT